MTVHHVIEGPDDAPVVVLSNSLGNDLTMWDEQLPALEGFRVVRYDQRGHGRTPPQPGPYGLDELGADVLELLDELGVHRAHFAGVSLGGMTGMWLAQNHPERIGGLALLCTSAQLGGEHWNDRAATVREQGTASLVDNSLGRWFTPEFARRTDVAEKYRRMLSETSDEGYAGCCEAIAAMDLLPRLPEITARTLVVAGKDDPATPPAHAEQIASTVDGAHLEVVDDAAHLANVQQADEVNRLLREHFAA